MKYRDFVASKAVYASACGFDPSELAGPLFGHQDALARWAVRRGRAAVFASTGLGKTRVYLSWADAVARQTGGRVLVLTPLAVAPQGAAEAAVMGLDARVARDGSEVCAPITVTNYDRLHRFDPSAFAGVVLDESSCIKHHDAKTLRENGTMSRQGIPDYLLTLRAPGDVEHRVTHDPADYPVSTWQSWASPVWDDLDADATRTPLPGARIELEPLPVWRDINPSDTLQRESAREHDDERHIAPLQLEVIRRGVLLWTNPGDVVLSPFAGIGSEGHVALREGRRFVGCELKRSYYEQAAKNLRAASVERQPSLFEVPA